MPDAHDASSSPRRAMIAAFDAWKDQQHRRLTRELHDDFGQLLAAMKIDLSMLEQALAHRKEGWQQVQNLNELVDAMIASVRRIAAGQLPKTVEENGLYPALEQLAHDFGKRKPITFKLDLAPLRRPLAADVEHAIYRIVQEALANAVRHANATVVRIAATGGGDAGFELQIADNGRGATDADLRKPDCFGLSWMRERVVALGGDMSIGSSSGTGMRLIIRIPNAALCIERSA